MSTNAAPILLPPVKIVLKNIYIYIIDMYLFHSVPPPSSITRPPCVSLPRHPLRGAIPVHQHHLPGSEQFLSIKQKWFNGRCLSRQ